MGPRDLYESFNTLWCKYSVRGAAGWQSGAGKLGLSGGKEPNQWDRKKAWSSMNHSILSGVDIL
jgi:hypothetical protein